jgi:hypothetical protein
MKIVADWLNANKSYLSLTLLAVINILLQHGVIMPSWLPDIANLIFGGGGVALIPHSNQAKARAMRGL